MCGEPDESPDDECHDDEFDNDLPEGEQLAVGQASNATQNITERNERTKSGRGHSLPLPDRWVSVQVASLER